MGLLAVLVGQIVVFFYYAFMRFVIRPKSIQYRPPPDSTLVDDLWAHVSAPESFLIMIAYLSLTWMFSIMPASYYDLDASVNWLHVLIQFLVVDFWTFVDHLIEHNLPALYKRSHKFHHVFKTPKIYNAFNGAIPDTITLILIPLVLTSQICRNVNCWSYMAFGSLYASIFTLIHCEFSHPWDHLFRVLYFGTAWDHIIHHALFVYNYGHFFMYWDWIWGTYKDPRSVKELRISGLQDHLDASMKKVASIHKVD